MKLDNGQMIFTGVVFFEDGQWQGLCLDLNIATVGDNFQHCVDMLKEAVDLYIECAMGETPQERTRMLTRKAPFLTRLYWFFRITAGNIRFLFEREGFRKPLIREVPLPCPA